MGVVLWRPLYLDNIASSGGMINYEGFGMNWSWRSWVIVRNLPRGIKENRENLNQESLLSRPRFEQRSRALRLRKPAQERTVWNSLNHTTREHKHCGLVLLIGAGSGRGRGEDQASSPPRLKPKKFREEQIAYFHLIRHGPRRKRKYCHAFRVTVDGYWIDNRIYF
jgi:hypothetical protein